MKNLILIRNDSNKKDIVFNLIFFNEYILYILLLKLVYYKIYISYHKTSRENNIEINDICLMHAKNLYLRY